MENNLTNLMDETRFITERLSILIAKREEYAIYWAIHSLKPGKTLILSTNEINGIQRVVNYDSLSALRHGTPIKEVINAVQNNLIEVIDRKTVQLIPLDIKWSN